MAHFDNALKPVESPGPIALARGPERRQCRYEPTGYYMIHSLEIRNFRLFRHLRAEKCRRVNVIVGDSGSGKTALLEALFMALCADPGIAIRHRQQRGLESQFSGPPKVIEEAIFGDFFYDRDLTVPIEVNLSGTGPEARALRVTYGGGSTMVLPLGPGGPVELGAASTPFAFTWRDHLGAERTVTAQIGPQGLQIGNTGEILPDFFLFPANQTIGSVENASRFSDLSNKRRAAQFVEIFTREFDWIEDLSIEVVAGSPVVHAAVKGMSEKAPVPNVSGGINRMMAIMLALATRPKSITLVDEMQNGVYYSHHESMWRSILRFAREYDSQLFTTTHNKEWLRSLIRAAGNNVDDIALWRLELGEADKPVLFEFTGEEFKDGIEYGSEVRGISRS